MDTCTMDTMYIHVISMGSVIEAGGRITLLCPNTSFSGEGILVWTIPDAARLRGCDAIHQLTLTMGTSELAP